MLIETNQSLLIETILVLFVYFERRLTPLYVYSNDFGFICAGASNVGSYKRNAFNKLAAL